MLEKQNLNISVSQLLTYKGCQAGNKGELYQWDQTDNTGSRNTGTLLVDGQSAGFGLQIY